MTDNVVPFAKREAFFADIAFDDTQRIESTVVLSALNIEDAKKKVEEQFNGRHNLKIVEVYPLKDHPEMIQLLQSNRGEPNNGPQDNEPLN